MMSPVRYSLHYEDYSDQLMSRFGKLLQQQILVDMTLMCSSHTLRVHKAVLAASSPYFEEALGRAGAGAGEPLVVLKTSFRVLKSLVEFMYCGRTTSERRDLPELLAAAAFLRVKGLSRVTREGLGITDDEELPQFSAPVVISRPPTTAPGMSTSSPASAAAPPPAASTQERAEPQPSTSGATAAGAQPERPKMDAECGLTMHCVTRRQESLVHPFDILSPWESTGGCAGGYAEPPPPPRRLRRGRPGARRGSWGLAAWERRGGGAGAGGAMRPPERGRSSRRIHHFASMQEYMDQATSQAVDSITPPGYSTDSFASLGSSKYYPEEASACRIAPSGAAEGAGGVSSAMSQYVDALKKAGLPTDLPIVFETGDGSYVNVDEQVLLDMVQSNEIQYEVIERPLSLEGSVDPAHVKSIDDLSRCLHARDLFPSDDAGGLSAILPDSAEPYSLPEPAPRAKAHDDTQCEDGDLFSGGGMTDDVKKYYEEHFNMSLLPTETGDLRKSDCFDFELSSTAFKGDALDCLMSTEAPTDGAPRHDAPSGQLREDDHNSASANENRFEGLITLHEKRQPDRPDSDAKSEKPDVMPKIQSDDRTKDAVKAKSADKHSDISKENRSTIPTDISPGDGEALPEHNLEGGKGEKVQEIPSAISKHPTKSLDAGSEIEKIIDRMKSEKIPDDKLQIYDIFDFVSVPDSSEKGDIKKKTGGTNSASEDSVDVRCAVGLQPQKEEPGTNSAREDSADIRRAVGLRLKREEPGTNSDSKDLADVRRAVRLRPRKEEPGMNSASVDSTDIRRAVGLRPRREEQGTNMASEDTADIQRAVGQRPQREPGMNLASDDSADVRRAVGLRPRMEEPGTNSAGEISADIRSTVLLRPRGEEPDTISASEDSADVRRAVGLRPLVGELGTNSASECSTDVQRSVGQPQRREPRTNPASEDSADVRHEVGEQRHRESRTTLASEDTADVRRTVGHQRQREPGTNLSSEDSADVRRAVGQRPRRESGTNSASEDSADVRRAVGQRQRRVSRTNSASEDLAYVRRAVGQRPRRESGTNSASEDSADVRRAVGQRPRRVSGSNSASEESSYIRRSVGQRPRRESGTNSASEDSVDVRRAVGLRPQAGEPEEAGRRGGAGAAKRPALAPLHSLYNIDTRCLRSKVKKKL